MVWVSLMSYSKGREIRTMQSPVANDVTQSLIMTSTDLRTNKYTSKKKLTFKTICNRSRLRRSKHWRFH